MYSVNIYLDFPHGEFKLLETKYTEADNREDAKRDALEYAKEKYKELTAKEGYSISVMNLN